jgi:hypothetical protein
LEEKGFITVFLVVGVQGAVAVTAFTIDLFFKGAVVEVVSG